jgi:adenylosuccinate lyase
MQIDETASAQNLAHFGVFAAVERVLMAAVNAGADRQKTHEHLREQSLVAWAALARGEPNPLIENLVEDRELRSYLPPERVRELLDSTAYVGDAPERATSFAAYLRSVVSKEV